MTTALASNVEDGTDAASAASPPALFPEDSADTALFASPHGYAPWALWSQYAAPISAASSSSSSLSLRGDAQFVLYLQLLPTAATAQFLREAASVGAALQAGAEPTERGLLPLLRSLSPHTPSSSATVDASSAPPRATSLDAGSAGEAAALPVASTASGSGAASAGASTAQP